MPDHELSERLLLDRNPGVRQLVESRPDFIEWTSALPIVDVDGETLYVVRGDQLMDRDQIIVEWIGLHQPSLLERSQRMRRKVMESKTVADLGMPIEDTFYEESLPAGAPQSEGDRASVDDDYDTELDQRQAQTKEARSEVQASKQSEFPSAKSKRPGILVDGEELYRVEGDLLLDIDQLELYEQSQDALRARQEADKFVHEAGFGGAAVTQVGQVSQLIGIVQNGKLVRWAPGTVLSYCVLRRTFPHDDWYEEVAENMWLAVNDWASICGVEFQYVEGADESESLRPPEVLFPVRSISAGGAFIAAAFFPTDPAHRRRVLIDPSYHTTTYDRVGVLRHEVGHALGFRHEHISDVASPLCPDEDTAGTIDLTAYDPQSVMHYFCGGVGSRELSITDVDRVGAQLVYGPPLSNFQLLEK